MKPLFTFIVLLGITLSCVAESDQEIQELEKKIEIERNTAVANIPNIVEQYANLIGCNFSINPKNVVEYTLNKQKTFISLFNLDVGCSGGSAMSRPVIVTLKFSESYPKIYIYEKFSGPSKTSEALPQTISEIYVKENKIFYSALDFDIKKDALCCPSVPVTGELRFENNQWVGVSNENQSPNKSLKDAP